MKFVSTSFARLIQLRCGKIDTYMLLPVSLIWIVIRVMCELLVYSLETLLHYTYIGIYGSIKNWYSW